MKGGFGITYKTEHLALGTTVAIKEYFPSEFATRDQTLTIQPKSERHADMFAWGKARFLEEARTLARFRHPSIVRVLHVFEAINSAYMVLEFEDGRSLSSWLDGLGVTPTQEQLDTILTPLLSALEVMHTNDFIHRDIAPDNIIIRPDGSPVLLDFGSARHAIAEETKTLTGIVKAGYSPPEQYLTKSGLQGPWTDIYALGATLYRSIIQLAPPEAPARQLGDTLIPATASAVRTFRPAFLVAIDQALSLAPDLRPQSIAEFRAALFAEGDGRHKPGGPAHTGPTRKASLTRPLGGSSVGGEQAKGLGSRIVILVAVVSLVVLVSGVTIYFIGQNWPEPETWGDQTDRRSIVETDAWMEAQRLDTIEAFQRYLQRFPSGRHGKAARARLAVLEAEKERTRRPAESKFAPGEAKGGRVTWNPFAWSTTPSASACAQSCSQGAPRCVGWKFTREGDCTLFREDDPQVGGKKKPQARQAERSRTADTDAWLEAQWGGTIEAFESYISRFPAGQYVDTARAKIALLRTKRTPTSQAERTLKGGRITLNPFAWSTAPSASACAQSCRNSGAQCVGWKFGSDGNCTLYRNDDS